MKITEQDKIDIRCHYRQAKDQRKQISIEADLYNVPASKIKEVLGLSGRSKSANESRGLTKIPPEEYKAMADEVLAGRRCHAVAVEHHTNPQNFIKAMRRDFGYVPPTYRKKRALTAEQIDAAKKEYAAGVPQKDIAVKFGVCAMVICKAVNGAYDKKEEDDDT